MVDLQRIIADHIQSRYEASMADREGGEKSAPLQLFTRILSYEELKSLKKPINEELAKPQDTKTIISYKIRIFTITVNDQIWFLLKLSSKKFCVIFQIQNGRLTPEELTAVEHQLKNNVYPLDEQIVKRFGKSLRSSASDSDLVNCLRSLVDMCLPCRGSSQDTYSAVHYAAVLSLYRYFDPAYNQDIPQEINTTTTGQNVTPLHCAIRIGDLYLVTQILYLKPDLKILDLHGNSFIHWAAMSSFDVLHAVMNSDLELTGKFIRQRNKQGNLPLHLACYARNPQNMVYLLHYLQPLCHMAVPPVEDLPAELDHPAKRQLTWAVWAHSRKQREIDPTADCYLNFKYLSLDEREVAKGGNPLHWSLTRRSLVGCITLGFQTSGRNLLGESPLHVSIRRGNFKITVALLASGAGVNVRNTAGETPLHYAVMRGDIHAVEACLVFDADVNAKDNQGFTPLHLAAGGKPFWVYDTIVAMLQEFGAQRCGAPSGPSSKLACNLGCHPAESYPGKIFLGWPSCKAVSLYSELLLKNLVKQAATKDGTDELRRKAFALSLDGGGTRGVFTVTALMEVQRYLTYPIVNYFDWLAGTSTGALVAMFMSMGPIMSLEDIRNLYLTMKDAIFVGSRPYDSGEFEEVMKFIAGPETKMADISASTGVKLIATATTADRIPPKLHLFRNYINPRALFRTRRTQSATATKNGSNQQKSLLDKVDEYKNQVAWEALRASGAAPTFFSPWKQYLDGGVICTNPTLDLMTEMTEYNSLATALKSDGTHPADQELEEQPIGLVLSLGTGITHSRPVEAHLDLSSSYYYNFVNLYETYQNASKLYEVILYAAMEPDGAVAERAQAWCAALKAPYFRLTPRLSQEISLDVHDDEIIINGMFETLRYMRSGLSPFREQLQELIALLKSREPLIAARLKKPLSQQDGAQSSSDV